MTTNAYYQSDLAIHVGEFLAETIESIGMSQAELAKRMNRPHQAINEIVAGKKSVTPQTAFELESVTKVPAHIWMGLETEYQMVKARQEELKQLSKESELLPLFPYLELVKLNLVKSTRNALEKVEELKKFFGVADLFQLSHIKAYQPAFRVGNKEKVSGEAVAAWIQTGIVLAKSIKTAPYDEQKLNSSLTKIRKLVNEADVNDAINKIKAVLAECGVALIIMPHFKKTHVHGTTFWSDNGSKAVIMMSLRGGFSDIFWFSFFHELGHIVKHDKRELFLDDGHSGDKLNNQENEANEFASDILIPKKEYGLFVSKGVFTTTSIGQFAKTIDIKPSIVVGRLMHDKLVQFNDYRLLKMRDKYAFESSK